MSRVRCDECEFPNAHLVVIRGHGEMRLCGGCIANTRMTGAKVEILRFPIRRAA